jgi:hypothetical protein
MLVTMFGGFSTAAEPFREMFTDRPDVTESPRSVAPDFFQVEMSFFDYERDRTGIERLDNWVVGSMNLKYGITKNSDLQCIVNMHSRQRTSGLGSHDLASGFDDITLRYKQNLWGNDSGNTALALMPFATMPTHGQIGSEAWGGGLVIPFCFELTSRLSLGMMAQGSLAPDLETNGTDVEWLATTSVGMSLTKRWGAYTELIAVMGEDIEAQLRAASGFTWALSDNVVLDGGVRIGLNRAAPELGLFTGVSLRF